MTRLIPWIQQCAFSPTPMAAGMIRIALAIHYILILDMSFYHPVRWFASKPESLYQPIGIMNLYDHHTIPMTTLLVSFVWVARISVALMLVGLLTRLSTLITAVAMWHCCSIFYSFDSSPSHTFIPGLFAGFGLLFGCRSPISLDYLIRRWRQTATRNIYWQTPRVGVMLAMFAVGWPLANAALFKIYLGNKQFFAWVYSDNLRNALIFQWWKFQEPLPWYAEWLVARSWATKFMALGNVIAQGFPILACLMIRKPYIRFAIALLMISEIIGLTLLMNMWNGYGRLWLAFAFFFIDWDSLFSRWWPRGEMQRPVRTTQIFVWLGVAIFILPWMIMTCTTKYHRILFPIQPFTMFSNVQARAPYWESKPYANLVTEWQIDTTPPISTKQKADMFRSFHSVFHDRGDVAAEKIRAACEGEYKLRVHTITCTQAFHVVPAGPASTIEQYPRTTYVKWRRTDGNVQVEVIAIDSIRQIRSGPESTNTYSVTLRILGQKPSTIGFGYFDGLDPELKKLSSTKKGEHEYEFELQVLPKRKDIVITIIADDQPWFGYYIPGSM